MVGQSQRTNLSFSSTERDNRQEVVSSLDSAAIPSVVHIVRRVIVSRFDVAVCLNGIVRVIHKDIHGLCARLGNA
jgi:hypothetical protein